jgi:hypothetical protein
MTHVNRVMIIWRAQAVEFGVIVQGIDFDQKEFLWDTDIGRTVDRMYESLPYWRRRVDVTFIPQHPPVYTSKLKEVISWCKEAGFK